MRPSFTFLKTTLLGGVIFLLPIVILVTVVDKAVKLVKIIAEPLGKWLPSETVAGVALINLIAFFVVVVICFLGGLAARSILGKRLFESIDEKLLIIPGYAYYRAKISGQFGADKDHQPLKPVYVKLGPRSQIGLAVEPIEEDRIAVYLPGAPDPWRGTIAIVGNDQVTELNTDIRTTMQVFESLGRGSSKILK